MLFGKHINKYYIRYFPVLLLGIIALVVVDYMQLIIPEFYRTLVNGIINGTVTEKGVVKPFDMNYLLDEICLPLIFVIVSIVIGRFMWRVCFMGSSIKVVTDLRGNMFNRCKDLPQQYYHVNKVGGLMTLFTNDLETIQECFGWGVLMFFDAFMLGAMAIVKMAKMDVTLTVLAMIPMALLLIIGAIMDHHMEKRWDERQAAFSSLSDFAQESFSGIAVVKAFVKEVIEQTSFRKINKRNENANVAHTKLSTLFNVLVTLFVESVACVIIGYGGYLVWKDKFNAGMLVEFIGYFTSIIWPITAISQLIEMRARGKASLKRIGELLDQDIEVKDKEGVTKPQSLQGSIEFRNLTFRHPGGEYDALSNVSFKINAGENVGIIGKTGSGKTTIVDLILRTYNVADKTIFIDGYDVNDIPIKTVRQFVAYVPQDNFLFSDTIANNIAFACNDIDIQTIQNAAKMADIHQNIIEFVDGYDTILGERGVTVSGGQKQRISIARALLKDAGILILDDSVSAVDVKTEKIILENLRTLRNGKTTILIAHRISTIQSMDKIIFIDDGKIVDVGTHNELYDRCADYHNMVELQKLDSEANKQESQGEEVSNNA